jgi:hypothetical protein
MNLLNILIMGIATFTIYLNFQIMHGVYFLTILAHQFNLISTRAMWVWIAIFASPFVFNYVIFSPTLYGDQYIYTFEVVERAFGRERIQGLWVKWV